MRAYLVIGPERTGTRLATKVLLAAGCHGSDEHVQPFDTEPFGDLDPVVWRRSVPHNEEWLDLRALIRRFDDREITAVVTVRDWWCTAEAQVACSLADSHREARERMRRAYGSIFGQLTMDGIDYRLVLYESLVLHPKYAQRALLTSLGLRATEHVTVWDGDYRHWQTMQPTTLVGARP